MQHHVLVADDSRPSREELVRTLEGSGRLRVTQVENGAEALRAIEACRPDLALFDQSMPVLDGLQALKIVRARWSPVELPILMLTGSQSVNDKVAAFRFGANDYVTKPAHRQELLARVQAQLALKTAVQQNLAARDRLLQAAKLQTVGRLAAGLAHEINTPAQYVSDNLHFLERAIGSIQSLLAPLAGWAAGEGPIDPELQSGLRAAWRRQRLDFLLRQGPDAVTQGLQGIERIAALISELKAFTGPATDEARALGNVNDAITHAVAATRGDWQDVAKVDLDLTPDLPAIACHMAELGQVFLHLLYNAAEAIRGDFGAPAHGGTIRISTQPADGGVEILVSDDGPGIEASIRDQIFDPFFTTKPVGSGTGQGLAVGYDVIVNRHAGRITAESNQGGGACFRIWLPLRGPTPTLLPSAAHAA